MKKITVIYHKDCTDGFSSAVILNKRLSADPSLVITLLPLSHEDKLPLEISEHIFMVDFAYPKKELLELSLYAQSISIYDHHNTAISQLENIEKDLACPSNIVLDSSRAACQITWDESFPGLPRPKSIERIGDRDLGLFSHTETRSITAYFYSLPQDMKTWSVYLQDDHYNLALIIGEGLESKAKREVTSLLDKSFLSRIGGHPVCLVPAEREFASDIGEAMLAKHPDISFSISYRKIDDGFHFSLRSRKGEFDVSKFSEKFDGGGHSFSAGFVSTFLPWEQVKIPSLLPIANNELVYSHLKKI